MSEKVPPLPHNWKTREEQAELRLCLAYFPDAPLQELIKGALERREEHARKGHERLAQQWNDFLRIACQARDERERLRLEIDDSPFVIARIPRNELDDIPELDP